MDNGVRVPLSRIKNWNFDLAQDDPGISELNATRDDVFEHVLQAWISLNTNLLADCFTSNLEYGSFWVKDPMIGADKYKNYILGKFKTILSSGKKPAVAKVLLHSGKTPVAYTYALHLIQGDVKTLLLFSFDGEKICKMYMTDPLLYQFVPCSNPVMDENHDPVIFHAPEKLLSRGEMEHADFVDFAIKSYAGMIDKGQINVKKIITAPEKNCPHIILEYQERVCHLYCDIFLPPFSEGQTHLNQLQDFIFRSHQQGALPCLATLGMFCLDTNGKTAIYGGNFAMKYSPLFFL